MLSPTEGLQKLKNKIKKEWKLAFVSAVVLGLLIHMPMLLSDIPNHDGLENLYFDLNMITSGRWFLTVACGFSSYFTLPWLIGVLSLLFLGCTAAALAEILELHSSPAIVAVSGLLVAFPALASTFSYMFTVDGYMMALFLSVLSVLWVKKSTWGFLPGAVCLAFSLGIYQAYLPFAVLLCLYSIAMLAFDDITFKEKCKATLHYLYMGLLGSGLYFVILQILLKIQGKELASYQGINSMTNGVADSGAQGAAAFQGLFATIVKMYRDFAAFSIKGNVIFNNIFSIVAVLTLAGAAVCVLAVCICHRKWWKKWNFFAIIVILGFALPVAANIVMLISPEVTYHLLMRYQWVIFLILAVAFVEKTGGNTAKWFSLAAAFILIFNYAVTDNIAYSNLEERYEKTYAYCIRLLDRIEQTEGYYQGIPIAMVGVVGDEQYPLTDISGKVTDAMIGMNGDSLLYKAADYQYFMKYYLGATLNFLPAEEMADIYYSPEYMEMESFPGATSVKVVNGILYIKTENVSR